ncbi:MAG: 23S rRNA (adenine(2503)-C(2))-methyltransferase RlmN [Pseudomonadota bacterium]
MNRRPILALTLGDLAAALKDWNEPSYRAPQVFNWLYLRGARSFSEMTNLSKRLRERLEAEFEITEPGVERWESRDGTIKFRFLLADGRSVEGVWIPEEKRKTFCISSQVGCPLDCAFCVTGAMGFKRNLKAEEIVAQIRHVRVLEKRPVTNIVFMGMGEPLLNEENVARAIFVMCDTAGMAIGKRKITLSTAGIVPKIRPFLENTGVKLAVSLTGGSDEARDHWMPINRKYDLQALFRELRAVKLPKGRRITFEVVLMKGKNDTLEETRKLADLLRGIPSKVNLIPYNENPVFPDLKRPDGERVDEIREYLLTRKIHATVRKSRGEDILAACGQLAGKTIDQISA